MEKGRACERAKTWAQPRNWAMADQKTADKAGDETGYGVSMRLGLGLGTRLLGRE